MNKTTDIFLYAYGNAAENYACEQGPAVLLMAIKAQTTHHYHWHAPLCISHHKQKQEALLDVVHLSQKLSQLTQSSLSNHHFFITLGGDHTCAIGSWSGALSALSGDMGLIWFDAHMDSHTIETTLSQNIHGMPLAVLLGHGDPALTQLVTKKLKPENVVLIGVRSYEAGEAQLLKKLNVKIFYMEDIKKMGLKKVFEEAVTIVTKNTQGFGVSIDLDGFDPIDAPGVGSREKEGVRSADFFAHFSTIAHHPKLIGMEIAEFNPSLDKNHQTEQLAVSLINDATYAIRKL